VSLETERSIDFAGSAPARGGMGWARANRAWQAAVL
jgi:hypothetical protein